MDELEELKARASERSRSCDEDGDFVLYSAWQEAEADLDRAIAIAAAYWTAWESDVNVGKELLAETENELNEARAAVLTGRDAIGDYTEDFDVKVVWWMDDTKSYEQYR